MAKAEVRTEYPGIVKVRAIENREGLLRENSACGFFGTAKKPGDVFELNKPEEFSPRWMEFVEPDKLPEGWAEIIEKREADRNARLQSKAEMEKKDPSIRQAELVKLAVEQTIYTLAGAQSQFSKGTPSHEFNHSSGDFKRKPGRPANPKLDVEQE